MESTAGAGGYAVVPPIHSTMTAERFRKCLRATFLAAAAALLVALPLAARAQPDHGHPGHDHDGAELGHAGTGAHAAHPHFTHPLVTESPIPENQARFDVGFVRASDDGADELAAEASVEVALTPNVGLEFALPYVWIDPGDDDGADGVGNAEFALKFADYRFGRSGLVLGAGLELELPTGDDDAGTGDDRQIGLEPYFGFGYRRGDFELIGLLRFGVPVNERPADEDEVDLELAADVSLLCHLAPRVAGLLEFNGAAVVAGEADDTVLAVNPGVSFDASGDGRLRVGVGFGVPLTDDAGYDYEARTMVILHF